MYKTIHGNLFRLVSGSRSTYGDTLHAGHIKQHITVFQFEDSCSRCFDIIHVYRISLGACSRCSSRKHGHILLTIEVDRCPQGRIIRSGFVDEVYGYGRYAYSIRIRDIKFSVPHAVPFFKGRFAYHQPALRGNFAICFRTGSGLHRILFSTYLSGSTYLDGERTCAVSSRHFIVVGGSVRIQRSQFGRRIGTGEGFCCYKDRRIIAGLYYDSAATGPIHYLEGTHDIGTGDVADSQLIAIVGKQFDEIRFWCSIGSAGHVHMILHRFLLAGGRAFVGALYHEVGLVRSEIGIDIEGTGGLTRVSTGNLVEVHIGVLSKQGIGSQIPGIHRGEGCSP